MNIYLLNIPFAIVGVGIAVVPLLIGMKHQSRSEHHEASAAPTVDASREQRVKEYDRAT